jgi:hypothetical protein
MSPRLSCDDKNKILIGVPDSENFPGWWFAWLWSTRFPWQQQQDLAIGISPIRKKAINKTKTFRSLSPSRARSQPRRSRSCSPLRKETDSYFHLDKQSRTHIKFTMVGVSAFVAWLVGLSAYVAWLVGVSASVAWLVGVSVVSSSRLDRKASSCG